MKKILFGILVLCSVALVAQNYDFVSIENLIEQEVGRLIIPEIYKELGINVTITPNPGKRAQALATSGKKDGEIMRIWSYGEENKTTLRVPTPYYQLETMAFIKKGSGRRISSKEELKGLRIVRVRGVKHTDNISEGLENVLDVGSTEQMMKMLDSGRADVALTNTVDGLLTLKKMGIKGIIPMDKPLKTLDLYHYIHIKNKDLIPKVDAKIIELKSSGKLKEIIQKAEAKFIG